MGQLAYIKTTVKVKEREDWMILDDQFFTFHNLSKVYAVTDLMKL